MYVLEKKLTDLDSGVASDIPATTTLTVNGKAYTQPQIRAQIAQTLGLFKAVVLALSAYRSATSALHQALPGADQFYKELVVTLKQLLGKGNPVLTKFGISVQARKVPSVEKKTEAKAKRKLTRQARHTMGKNQKQAIVSNVQPTVQLLGPDGKPLAP